MVTNEDDVYAMGCNSSGCLGLGDTVAALQPRRIEVLCKKKIKGELIIFFMGYIIMFML